MSNILDFESARLGREFELDSEEYRRAFPDASPGSECLHARHMTCGRKANKRLRQYLSELAEAKEPVQNKTIMQRVKQWLLTASNKHS